MKYIKTFEVKYDDKDKMRRTQLYKLVVLKFNRKISKIFEEFGIETIFEEYSENQFVIKAKISNEKFQSEDIFYITRHEILRKIRDVEIYIRKLEYAPDSFEKSFEEFIRSFFNKDIKPDTWGYRENNFNFSTEELDELCDNIINEWELFRSVKKYNL